MAIGIKKYNGTNWVDGAIKKCTSGTNKTWADAYTYRYNGSDWIQIYPETYITTTKTVSSSSMNTYKPDFTKWTNDNIARQGNGTEWGGPARDYGYMDISAASYPGSGNIQSIDSATFTSTRGGSGAHGTNVTIKFYRSSVVPKTVPTTSDMYGNFTATAGTNGSGNSTGARTISMGTNGLNWMNAVGGRPQLWITSNLAADYASFTTKSSVKATYTYEAVSASYNSPAKIISLSSDTPTTLLGQDSKVKMIIYSDETNMSFEEIMKRRDEGLVEFIDPSNLNTDFKSKPITREYEIKDGKVYVEVLKLQWDNEVQFSVDGIEWNTMRNVSKESDYLYGTLPEGYDKNRDYVYVKIIDKVKDSIEWELTIEPLFLVL